MSKTSEGFTAEARKDGGTAVLPEERGNIAPEERRTGGEAFSSLPGLCRAGTRALNRTAKDAVSAAGDPGLPVGCAGSAVAPCGRPAGERRAGGNGPEEKERSGTASRPVRNRFCCSGWSAAPCVHQRDGALSPAGTRRVRLLRRAVPGKTFMPLRGRFRQGHACSSCPVPSASSSCAGASCSFFQALMYSSLALNFVSRPCSPGS